MTPPHAFIKGYFPTTKIPTEPSVGILLAFSVYLII